MSAMCNSRLQKLVVGNTVFPPKEVTNSERFIHLFVYHLFNYFFPIFYAILFPTKINILTKVNLSLERS